MMDEVDICRERIRHLLKDAIVYQEVPVTHQGETFAIDIVHIESDDWLVVTECKRTLTMGLVKQVTRWVGCANELWAAVEHPKHKSKHHVERASVLRRWGVGLLYISESMIYPAHHGLQGPCTNLIRDSLCDGQKSSIAGSAGVKRARKDKWEDVRKLLSDFGEQMTARSIAEELEWSVVKRREFSNLACAGKIRQIGCERWAAPRLYFLEQEQR